MTGNGSSPHELSEELEEEMLMGQFVNDEFGKAFFGKKAFEMFRGLLREKSEFKVWEEEKIKLLNVLRECRGMCKYTNSDEHVTRLINETLEGYDKVDEMIIAVMAGED